MQPKMTCAAKTDIIALVIIFHPPLQQTYLQTYKPTREHLAEALTGPWFPMAFFGKNTSK